MADFPDLTPYVDRVAAVLAPRGSSQEAVNLAHVRARRAIDILAPELALLSCFTRVLAEVQTSMMVDEVFVEAEREGVSES